MFTCRKCGQPVKVLNDLCKECHLRKQTETWEEINQQRIKIGLPPYPPLPKK